MRHLILLCTLLFVAPTVCGQIYPLQYIDTKTDASFRGMSVTTDNSVWVSGSKGWIGRSTNGGKGWTFKQVPGYETKDFRSVYAQDSNHAIIANAGTPAYILRTADGGKTWQKVYENTDSAAFIDGVDFWNKKHGLIHGDPIDGRMLVLYTKDGGRTWKERKNSPRLAKGEASFAASGTTINCFLHSAVVVATGGKTSRLLMSRSRGKRWRSIPTPMLAESESTGIFSFASDAYVWEWYIAGGDYKHDSLQTNNFFYSKWKGKNWEAAETTTRGYRECLALLYGIHLSKQERPKAIFAVGPSGIDISTDYGVQWKALHDDKGFHVIKALHYEDKLVLAGSNGKLAVLTVGPE